MFISGTTSNWFEYDASGRLIGMHVGTEGTLGYGYDSNGLPSEITLPGGTVKRFGFDGLFSLVSNGVVDAANNSVMNRGYARNAVQNITARNTEAGNYSYKYDTIDQLTNVMLEGVAPSTPSTLATNESFAYDPMGNRLSSARATGTLSVVEGYSPNSLNQYASLAYPGITNSLTYDQNGNILALPGGAGPTDPPSLSLVWDAQDRLAAVYNATNSDLIAQYYYDPFGRRIKKATYSGGSSNVTYYLYADEGLIGEFDINGTELRSYEYLPGSLWMNDPIYIRTGGQTYYFLTDHLGAPQKLVNGNGAVVWSMTSEAFGETAVSPDSTVTNNLRFSSQYFDEETGLHYNTMRYYDTKLGRYLSRDPIGEDGGVNVYGYVNGHPVISTDVLGLADDLDTLQNSAHVNLLTDMATFAYLQKQTLYIDKGGEIYNHLAEEAISLVAKDADKKLKSIDCCDATGIMPIDQGDSFLDPTRKNDEGQKATKYWAYGGQLFPSAGSQFGPAHYNFYTVGNIANRITYKDAATFEKNGDYCCYKAYVIMNLHIDDSFNFDPDRNPSTWKGRLYNKLAKNFSFVWNDWMGASKPNVLGDIHEGFSISACKKTTGKKDESFPSPSQVAGW